MKPILCSGCPLQGEGYAFGEGPEDATVCLVGEALGSEEARLSRPFVGGAGRVLNSIISKANLRRSNMYITNIIKCRTPNNRVPTSAECTECMSRHDMQTFLRRFNLIVLLGAIPLESLTERRGPTTWRGSVFVHNSLKYLSTIHPAYVMRQQEMFPIAVADLSKIHQEGWTPDLTLPDKKYTLEADESHLRDLITDNSNIAFDVETSMRLEPAPGSVTIVGITDALDTAYVFRDIEGMKPMLQQLFSNPGTTKIGHNIMFDIRHMEAQGIKVEGPLFDTMIAHHLVLSDVPNDLAFAASLYTRMPYWKNMMKENLELYNANDVDATYQIYDTLEPEIKSKGLTRVFNTSMAVMPVLQAMSDTGIGIDIDLQTRWRVGLERTIQRREKELSTLVNDVLFNWRSPQQLAKLLYDKLKLPRYYSKHKGSVTTNEEALEDLLESSDNPILMKIMELRHLSKLASTYFSHPESPDGRIHCEYLLHGTATGRLSSRNPNLQNVPKGPARSIYIARPGFVFISADYNQIELRIAALLAKEERLLEAFTHGEDVHRVVASEVYHIRPSEVTDLQRFRAKFIVYGLGYGRGARSLARSYKLPIVEAERFITEYFTKFARIKVWRQQQLTEATSQGYLVNPFGRRRYFFGQNITTKIYNFTPSSTAADVILEATVRLARELPREARLLLHVHDQVVVECPEELKERAAQCLKDVMEAPVDVLDNYVIPVKVKTGYTWKEVE